MSNTHRKVAIWKTAGGGKTDFVAFLTSKCRDSCKPSLAVCLNTDARDEMYSRGLSTLEANNWHALEKRNLEMKLGAIMKYENAEADAVNKYEKMRLVLEPCNAKTRLLLRLVLEQSYDEPLRLPMHKIFVEYIVQLVRCVSDGKPERTQQLTAVHVTGRSLLLTGQTQRSGRSRATWLR